MRGMGLAGSSGQQGQGPASRGMQQVAKGERRVRLHEG